MNMRGHVPGIRLVRLEEIDPKEVVVVMEACCGAMGDSGAFELYSIHNGEVLYFYGNAHIGDLDLREARKYLPEGTWYDDSFCFHWDRKNWEVFGGGMGNVFVIKEQYYEELVFRCRNGITRNYYRACVPFLEELLLDIASGRTTGIRKSESDAPREHRVFYGDSRKRKKLDEFLE